MDHLLLRSPLVGGVVLVRDLLMVGAGGAARGRPQLILLLYLTISYLLFLRDAREVFITSVYAVLGVSILSVFAVVYS